MSIHDLSRRGLLAVSLAASCALMVPPAFAAPIQTDSEGLVTEEVKVPIKGGEIAAYVAYPKQGKSFIPILVAHDVWGVNDQLKDVARRLAKLGYYAICPDLYSRQGDVSKMKDEIDIMRTVVSKVLDADILSDLYSAVTYARKTGKADAKKLGITGFGWGGRVVWLYAAFDPKLQAGVSWYGFLNAPRDPAGHSAIALAQQIKVPVLGLYGSKDDFILESDANAMKGALAVAKKSEIDVFPGAKHGFFSDDRPTYDAKTAADGWERMKVWFKNNGL